LVASALYAVVAPLSALSGDLRRAPLLVAGAALTVVGLLSMALLRQHAWAFLPSVVLGVAGAAVGGILLLSSFEANRVAASSWSSR